MRCLIGFFVAAGIFGQSGEHPSSPRPAARALHGPAVLDHDSLGPAFLGHDIRAVIADLDRISASGRKSEFETTAQYGARMKSFQSEHQGYVFVLSPREETYDGELTFRYDADSGVLTGTVKFSSLAALLLDDHEGKEAFVIRTDTRLSGQHVGVNAFGVRRLVSTRVFEKWGLLISAGNGVLEKENRYSEFGYVFNLRVAAREAVELKPNLRIALACSISEPTVYKTDSRFDATVTHPVEAIEHQRLIIVSPEQLLLFDRRTGRILARTERPR